MPPKKANKSLKQPKPKAKKAVGFGSQKIAPVSLARTVKAATPRITRGRDGATIYHREFFSTVSVDSVNFLVDAISINPGNPVMFPWLSTQALGWERYRFKTLKFHYVPRCSTSQSGTLILSPDYDAADEAPSGEAGACSYADSTSSVAWAETTLSLRKEPMMGGMTTKFVRSGVLASNLDIKTYDVGQLFVCRDSTNASLTVWGKLWVEYEIEFLTPHTIPTPFTSTYAATFPNTGGPQGIPPNYPVPISTTAGTIVKQAGPIVIGPNSTVGPTGLATGYTLSGLAAGALYLVQFIVEAGGINNYVTSASPIVTGMTKIADTMATTFTYAATAAGNKCILSETLYRATSSLASLTPVLSWASGALGVTNAIGTQLIASPVVNSAAWTLL